VFQQSLGAGKFPTAWKHAVVIPLYKGRGDRSQPSAYRPISLCSCMGKLLEKIVQAQLTSYLHLNNHLSAAQHGFMPGKSTVTNMVSCDAVIADIVQAGHCYDKISFDFQAAFDKAPHSCVLNALVEKGIRGKALDWYASFLRGRTQQVKVGDALSEVGTVVSGVIQGSACGPGLYTVLADTLLKRVTLPKWGFADDFKLVADVTVYSRAHVQAEVNRIVQWSDDNLMPLSICKCGVLHCGSKQPRHTYVIRGAPMVVFDSFQDLGMIRSASGRYEGHCEAVVARAKRASGAIRHVFHLNAPHLLWPAYQIYVQPILMYGSVAWNPTQRRDIHAIESVQRRLTKTISGLRSLSYESRLGELGALSLERQRQYADMVFCYKALHGMFACPAEELGLHLRRTGGRGGGIRLMQRSKASSGTSSTFYSIRAPSNWNKLPLTLLSSASLQTFKHKLRIYLLNAH
jgi:Reverse transcriptase (RNA-dependent DNA polymerase)